MENNQQRVLAYNLATSIKEEELEQVSGGKSNMSTHQTLKATGDSARGGDVAYDVGCDW